MSRLDLDGAQLDQLARDLSAVGAELGDLDAANREAARIVVAASRPPRRSGTLAASSRTDVTGQGVTFASTARYWTFVHWGAPRRNIRARPWFAEAVDHSRADVVAVYAKHAADTLNKIG